MDRLRPWVLAMAWLALGCGGDDDAPAGSVSTGLPPESLLSELSDAQLEQVCESFLVAVDAALADQVVLLDCTVSSISASTGVSISGQVRFDVAMCEQLVTECVAGRTSGADAGVPTGTTSNLDCASSAATEAQRSCDATVRQYERCYSALVDDLDGVDVLLDCEQALMVLEAQQAMTPVSPRRVPPPQCVELMEICPQISVPATRPAEP